MDICQLETVDQTTISVFVFHPSAVNANNKKFVLVASPNACKILILFVYLQASPNARIRRKNLRSTIIQTAVILLWYMTIEAMEGR